MQAVILNVDDKEVNRYIRTQILTQAGYRVVEASSGEEALELVGRERPQLVLLDVNLPDQSGIDVCRKIKDYPSQCTIVVLHVSAERTRPEDRVSGLELGADGYLVEPVEPELLVATIRSMLRLWQAEHNLIEHSERLQQSEFQLSLALEAARMGLWWKEVGSDQVTLSPAAAAIVGVDAGVIPSERWLEMVAPESRDEVTAKLASVMAGKSEYHAEYPVADGGGRLRWVSSHGKLVRHADGTPHLVAGIVQDITERKAALDAVLESENQFRTLANSIPQLCWMANADGWLFWYNDRWYQYSGTTPAEMDGWGWTKLHDPAVLPTVLERWKASLASGEPFEMVFPLRGADGVFRPFLTLTTPVRDSAGRIVRWFGTNTDISSQVENERKARENEERFVRLVESNIIGIVVADLNGINAANDLFLQLIGCSREDLNAGRANWLKATPPEHVWKDYQAIDRLREKGWCEPYEKEYVRPDGTRTPILIGAAVLKPEPLEWIAFVLDLTERKALEKRLAETQKLESIGLLAGGIAHDFNNLLVGVLGNASLVQDALPPNDPSQRFLGEIVNAADRAAHLTRQMLAYAGKGRFVMQRLDLSETVRDVMVLIRSSIPSDVDVRLELADGKTLVEADPAQMQQLVMNLVLNAAEAVGGRPGSITVRCGPRQVSAGASHQGNFNELSPGDYVELRVQDTGCGMDEDTKAKIFDPFFTTKFTGRGLGLAAVSGIIRGHQGAIQVQSTPGRGTSFTVLLPHAGTGTANTPQEEKRDAGYGGSETILIVDDEDVVRNTARSALERRGFRVLSASSGQEAVRVLSAEKDRVSLVILDLSMPGMDGHETLHKLRDIVPDIRVVLSSGYNESECMRLFGGEKLAGFVQKPYTSGRLTESVKAALAG